MRHLQDIVDLVDDHAPSATAAGSVEPMRKADHKAKKHSKPRRARKSEKLGGGHFVFRRHADGRIHPRQDPFEHGSLEAAQDESERLASVHGGTFEVFSRTGCGGVVLTQEEIDDVYDVDDEAMAFHPARREGGAA